MVQKRGLRVGSDTYTLQGVGKGWGSHRKKGKRERMRDGPEERAQGGE